MMLKFTPARTQDVPAPTDGKPYLIHYDIETRGLGLRVTRNGARSWIFNYRTKGVERRLTIGGLKDWPLKLARDEAHRLRRLVDQGKDPMAERHADRAAPMMRDLVQRWRDDEAPKKRPRTVKEYEKLLAQWVLPEFGNRKIVDITDEAVARLHRKITQRGTPVRANRTAVLLSYLFNLAIKWKLRADNPVKGLDKNPEEKRERYLTPDELERLGAALDGHNNQQAVNIVRLALLTGARRGEVLAMRWDQLDLGEPAVWTKPASTTKQKRLHRVPLNSDARDLLIALKREAEGARREPRPYVFAAKNPVGHVTDIKRVWATLCRNAGIANLRLHDLRHSFASFLVSDGFNLPVIGALLGHSQAATTARYAHLADSAQRQATERLGTIVRKNSTGEIVDFPKERRS